MHVRKKLNLIKEKKTKRNQIDLKRQLNFY